MIRPTCKGIKVWFYIALCPVRWTAQTALPVTIYARISLYFVRLEVVHVCKSLCSCVRQPPSQLTVYDIS